MHHGIGHMAGYPPGKGQVDTRSHVTDIWWPTWVSDLGPPRVTSGGGGKCSMQAGGTHPTGMFSC